MFHEPGQPKQTTILGLQDGPLKVPFVHPRFKDVFMDTDNPWHFANLQPSSLALKNAHSAPWTEFLTRSRGAPCVRPPKTSTFDGSDSRSSPLQGPSSRQDGLPEKLRGVHSPAIFQQPAVKLSNRLLWMFPCDGRLTTNNWHDEKKLLSSNAPFFRILLNNPPQIASVHPPLKIHHTIYRVQHINHPPTPLMIQ